MTAVFAATVRAILRSYFVFRPLGSHYGAAAWAVVIPLWVFLFWQIVVFGLHLTWHLEPERRRALRRTSGAPLGQRPR